jgi:inosine-uridine nucleoside N-ribohydrolase
MKRVIIDTDPGIDDAAALFLALTSPELSVEAITTVYGNGPVEICTQNTLRILNAAGRLEIPVYQGAARPLLREPTPGWASQVHGQDGLGNINYPRPAGHYPVAGRPAAVEIIERVMASQGEITMLALGRMTNLALAMSLEPGLAGSVAQIIVMGGAVAVPGNASPVASANLYEDPEAASILYKSGAPLVQVGLDVCNQVEITSSQLLQIEQTGTAITGLLSAATPFLQSYYRSQNLLREPDGVRYNDLSAAAYAIDPTLFQAEEYPVTIETHSELARGQTVVDRRALGQDFGNESARVRVCLEVDAERLTSLFTQRICAYRPQNS